MQKGVNNMAPVMGLSPKNPSSYGVSTFFACVHPSESCGSNGLPLTPNSIRIIGRAPALYQISHPHLCSYIDVVRGKHERIVVVQEYHQTTLTSFCEKVTESEEEAKIIQICYQILQGLEYLNGIGTVCCNLHPDFILIDSSGIAKLYQYGLYYLTEGGVTISFPIGTPKYLPPEFLASSFSWKEQRAYGSVAGCECWDAWSIGIIILESLLHIKLFAHETIQDTVTKIIGLSDVKDPLKYLVSMYGCEEKLENISKDMVDFLEQCLIPDPMKRPSPSQLLRHKLFSALLPSKVKTLTPIPNFVGVEPSEYIKDFSQYQKEIEERNQISRISEKCSIEEAMSRLKVGSYLAERPLREVYHLWQLVGGNVVQELVKQQIVRNTPSILTLPTIMTKEGEVFGGGAFHLQVTSSDTILLPLDALRKKLSHVSPKKFYPLVTVNEGEREDSESIKLPIVIREKDAEYQLYRLLLFERLLKGYPFKIDAIIKEARKDIPPFYRSYIWACLLRIDGDIVRDYQHIDKDTQTSTDRQIEVDIPRCHQYDELLSSPQGHLKFTRILKAWVVSHPNLVYWQGLDSLCAPFLYLNFQNEGVAYACLSAFIGKYLRNFFLRDNSAVIQEYLAKFSHLIAFHEPQLFNHLHSIGFIPELYAIPWFLTMFTHVFPLHKIFLLWDTLLLGRSSLPLCVGLAILLQLKDRLSHIGFNECILLFSDMPDIIMEQVVKDAIELFCATPASIIDTSFAGQNSHGNNSDLTTCGIDIKELKAESCGRISACDVIELMTQRRSRSGSSKVLLLDVRPQEEYLKGSLIGAISFPSDSVLDSEGKINLSGEGSCLPSNKGKIIIVVGSFNLHDKVMKVAHALLQKGYPRICTLHRGLEVFKKSGQIIVPSLVSQ